MKVPIAELFDGWVVVVASAVVGSAVVVVSWSALAVGVVELVEGLSA